MTEKLKEENKLNLTSNKGLLGKFVKDRLGDWLLCCYEYGDERLISCVGLGKSGSFPILVDTIYEVKEAETYLSKHFPKDKVTIWKDDIGRLFVIYNSDSPNVFVIHRIDLVYKKDQIGVIYSDFENLGYTYQLDGLTLIDLSDELLYEDKLIKETYPSIKYTVEQMVNNPDFLSKVNAMEVVDFIDTLEEYVPEDIVSDKTVIKKVKGL